MIKLRADFRSRNEDSNFSVFSVLWFTEWPGPLHCNCLSCRNPFQTPHSLNCLPLFTDKRLKPFFSLRGASSHPLSKKLGSDKHVGGCCCFMCLDSKPKKKSFNKKRFQNYLLVLTQKNRNLISLEADASPPLKQGSN